MRKEWIVAMVAAFAAFQVTQAHAQSLAAERQWDWPAEFSSSRLSCTQFHATRAAYLKRPRPAFNCMKGVDCPDDMSPAAPTVREFRVYYEWVDPEMWPVSVSVSQIAAETIKIATTQVLQDLDRVARSKSRAIQVVGMTDTSGSAKFRQALSQAIAMCVKDAVEVSLHLNGYQGAYDFKVTAVAATQLDKPTAPGVREPLNRNASVTISY